MDIRIDASSAEISGSYDKTVRIIANDVEKSDILDHFNISDIVEHWGIADILDHIGESEAREHFGLEEE